MTQHASPGRKQQTSAHEALASLSTTDQVGLLSHLFATADSEFRQRVRRDGKLKRISETIDFSAESLFTSLMQIGLPPAVAIRIPFEIIPYLISETPNLAEKVLTTADIRIAVVHALHSLENVGPFNRETISIWSAAYIRRYGNPSTQFVKVIDNGEEVDLNYDYIRRTVLPHLVTRILQLPKDADPIEKYGDVFSSTVLSGMSQEIISAVNTLNLYGIRYKTLLNLLQDLVLEPPHPWMVSPESSAKVVDYNIERAEHHLTRATSSLNKGSLSIAKQAVGESAKHTSAAMLAHYGAFLGVGDRYGLLELRRMLRLRLSNAQLWEFCHFHNIERDLRAMGSGIDALAACVARMQSGLASPSLEPKVVESLRTNSLILLQVAKSLCGEKVGASELGRPFRGIEYVTVRLSVTESFDSFDIERRKVLCESLQDFLEYPDAIEILRIERGSTHVYVKLSRHQAEQLIWALRRGLLSSMNVSGVDIVENAEHPKSAPPQFDVFMCHNSEDKQEVKRISLWLKNRGISPWLDEWELRPGMLWQRELETQIDRMTCAAVFIGDNGMAPWQNLESEALLRKFVERRALVIPVILKSCSATPKLPTFLSGMHWVDFRKRKPNPYHQLHFGIRGVRVE